MGWEENESYLRQNECGISSSGVLTGDTAVKTAAGKVYWITLSTESAVRVQINDSTDDSGTDKWEMRIPDNGHEHINLDPPLECTTGIYVDCSGECTVVVGYS